MNTTNRHTLTRFIPFILLLLAVATLSLPMAIRYAAAEPAEPAAVSAESKIYLPLVVKPQTAAAVQNANFENGRTGWVEFSNDGQAVIRTDQPVTAYSGSWVAWLGGAKNNVSSITQQVTVPSTTPYLAYYQYIASADLCGYDKAYVFAGATQVTTYDLCTSNNTNGWVKRVVNLSAYAGQSIALQIRVTTDSTLNSSLFIDDVSFQTSAAAAAETTMEQDMIDDSVLIFKSGEIETAVVMEQARRNKQ